MTDELTSVDLVLDSFNDVRSSTQLQYAVREDFPLEYNFEKVTGFSLLWVRIPFTYYVVNTCNNRFVLNVLAVDYTITIPPGTYNSINLPLTLKSALTIATVPDVNDFNFYISNIDMKLVIWNSINTFSVDWNTVNGNTQLGDMFGFFQNSTPSSVNGPLFDQNGGLLNGGAPVNYIKANEVVNLLGEQRIRVEVGNLNTSKYSSVNSSLSNLQTVAIVPVNTNFGGVIEYFHKKGYVGVDSILPINQLSFGLKFGDFRQNGYTDVRGTPSKSEFLSLEGSSYTIGLRFFMQNTNAISVAEKRFADAEDLNFRRRKIAKVAPFSVVQ